MNYIVNLDAKNIKPYFIDAILEYEKRLSRYCKIKRVDISEDTFLMKRGYKILICSDGDSVSSTSLADKIQQLSVSSVSDILISLKPSLQPAYDSRICISQMRIDPGLLAVILFEQLYRGYKIIGGEPYHK